MKAIQDYHDDIRAKAEENSAFLNEQHEQIYKECYIAGFLAGYVRRDLETEEEISKIKIDE